MGKYAPFKYYGPGKEEIKLFVLPLKKRAGKRSAPLHDQRKSSNRFDDGRPDSRRLPID